MTDTKYVQLTSNCYIDDQMFARCDKQNEKCSFYTPIEPFGCKYFYNIYHGCCTNAHAVKAIQYPVVTMTTTSCPSCSAWSNLPEDDFSEDYKNSTPINWENDQDYIDTAMMCGNDLTEPIKLKTGKTRAGKSVKVKKG